MSQRDTFSFYRAILVVGAAVLGFGCGGSTIGGVDDGGGLDTTGDLVPGDALTPWEKLEVDIGSGPCAPMISCTSRWTVSPDGHVEKDLRGDAGVTQMTPADLIALDAMVTSAPFLEGMTKGFVCDPPPTDIFASLRFDRGGASQMQNVTGCVIAGPRGNLAQRVTELVRKY